MYPQSGVWANSELPSRAFETSRVIKVTQEATSFTSSRNLNNMPLPTAHCKFEIVIEGWVTSYWPWPLEADLVRGDGHDWPAFILALRYGPIDCSTRAYNWSLTLAILNYLFEIQRSCISGCILLPAIYPRMQWFAPQSDWSDHYRLGSESRARCWLGLTLVNLVTDMAIHGFPKKSSTPAFLWASELRLQQQTWLMCCVQNTPFLHSRTHHKYSWPFKATWLATAMES